MKSLHQARINVFCRGDEDESPILEKLKFFIPIDFEKEKVTISKNSAEGFGGKKMLIFKVVLNKDKHLNMFLKNLSNRLDKEQKELILEQAESRLDNELNFFLRFDKDKLLNEDKLQLTDSGNCFHLKLSIASFPAKRENALEVIKEIFK